MKNKIQAFVIAAIVFVNAASAQPTSSVLSGEWNGRLELPTTIIPLELHFELSGEGNISGTMSRPESPERPSELKQVSFSQGVLEFSVAGTQLTYSGEFSNDLIIGDLNQGNNPVPLALRKGRYEDFILKLPEELQNKLLGQWHAKIKNPMGGTIIVYRFEIDEVNRLIGYSDVPEQQQLNMPITNASLDGDNITFEVPRVKGGFEGRFKGNQIVGDAAVAANGQKVSLNFIKGEYTIPYALDLTERQKTILQGRWVGHIEPPGGDHENIFRFFPLNNGQFCGFVDNPTTGQIGMKVKKLSLDEDNLKLETYYPPGTFRGKIAGNEISGRWTPKGTRLSIPGIYKKLTK